MTIVEGNTTISVQAAYEDDGSLYGKADNLGMGNTVISVSNPAGEMVLKLRN